MVWRSEILECLVATLGKVSGSALGFPDNLAATLRKVLESGLGILDGVAAVLFSGVPAVA